MDLVVEHLVLLEGLSGCGSAGPLAFLRAWQSALVDGLDCGVGRVALALDLLHVLTRISGGACSERTVRGGCDSPGASLRRDALREEAAVPTGHVAEHQGDGGKVRSSHYWGDTPDPRPLLDAWERMCGRTDRGSEAGW